jgi:hypothetical protein
MRSYLCIITLLLSVLFGLLSASDTFAQSSDPLSSSCITDPGDVSSCENYENLSDNKEIRNGRTVCTQTSGTYTITLDGSTLVISGSANVTLQGNIRNNSKIYVNSGATLTIEQFDSNTKIYNRGSLTVNSKVNINGSGGIFNAGTMVINGDFGIDAPFDNSGKVTVTGGVRFNGSAKAVLGANSVLKVTRVEEIDAQILGCGGCLHSIEKMDKANIVNNSQGNILTPTDHLIYVCAQNGFGSVFRIDENGRSGGAIMESGCDRCNFSETPDVPDEPSTLPISITGETTICAGESVTLTANASQGSGNYTYQWTTTGFNETGATITVLPQTTTTYTVKVTDNTTQQTGSATVTVKTGEECPPTPDALSISITGETTICAGDTVTLTATASQGSGNHTYQWTATDFSETGATITVTPQTTTTYTVKVTDSTGKTGSATATVTVKTGEECPQDPDTLLVNIASDRQSICAGDTVTLTATASQGNGNYTYQWTAAGFSETGASITVSPQTTTTYTVKVTYDTGKTGSATVTVTVKTSEECPGNPGNPDDPDDSDDSDDPGNENTLPPCMSDPGERGCTDCTPVTPESNQNLHSGDYCITTPGTYSVDLNNNAHLTICGSGTYTITLTGNYNKGSLTINPGAVVHINRISPEISITNKGSLTILDNVTIGSNTSIINTGRLEITGDLDIDGTFENGGTVEGIQTLKLNGSAKFTLAGPSVMNVQRISTLDAQILGCLGGCLHSVEKINNANVINNRDKLTPDDHSVLICAQNGFGNIFGTGGKSGGATLQSGCDRCENHQTPQPPKTPDDSMKVTIDIPGGDSIICQNTATTLQAHVDESDEDSGEYTYEWQRQGTTLSTNSVLTVSPDATTTYTVIVTDKSTGKTSRATLTIKVLRIEITRECDNRLTLSAVSLNADHNTGSGSNTDTNTHTNSGTNTAYTYEWSTGETSRHISVAMPDDTTPYSVEIGNGNIRCTATVLIDPADYPGEASGISNGQPDLPDSAYDCSECQAPAINNNRIELNNAGRYCLTTSGTYAQVRLNHPEAALVICASGTINIGTLELNGGDLIIGQNATVTCSSQGVNHPQSDLYNRGHLTVSGLSGNTFSMNGGTLVNVGTLTVQGNLNPSNYNGGSFSNYGKTEISGMLGPFNGGNVYLEYGSVLNTLHLGDIHENARLIGTGCIHYSGTVGNLHATGFTQCTPSICRQSGAGTTSDWGVAQVTADCNHCRMVVIPPAPVTLCDTIFANQNNQIDFRIQVSGGSETYRYSWSSSTESKEGIHTQSGPLHPIIVSVHPSVTQPLTADYTEEITLTITDEADNTQKTVKLSYTILACNPLVPPCCYPPDTLCGFLVRVDPPTCGNNGQISLLQNTPIGHPNPTCSVVWTRPNGEDETSAFTLEAVSAGSYTVAIDCGDKKCEATIPVTPSTDKNGGLLATYYYTNSEEEPCKVALEQKESTVDFDASRQAPLLEEGTLSTVRWTGFLEPPCDGAYTFFQEPAQSGQLYLNDTLVGDASVSLIGGERYPIVYTLSDYSSTQKVKITWQTPTDCGTEANEVIPSCYLIPHNLVGMVPTKPGSGICPKPDPDPEPCDKPVIDLPAVVDICEAGQSVTLKAIAYGTFIWSTGAKTSSIEVSQPGFYTVTVTNWCGKSAEKEVQVNRLSNETVNARVVSNDPCTGLSELRATGGKTYRWSPSETLSDAAAENPIAAPAGSTPYTVEIQTPGGCTVTKEVYVEVKTPFETGIEENEVVGCLHEAVTLRAFGADKYEWFPKDGLRCMDSRCATVEYTLLSDERTITVTGYKDGCSKQSTVTVRTNLTNDVSFRVDELKTNRENCSVPFIATPGFDRYTWDFGDKSENRTTDAHTIEHQYALSGTYEVCVTLEHSDCAQDVKKACGTITVKPEECACEPCRNE